MVYTATRAESKRCFLTYGLPQFLSFTLDLKYVAQPDQGDTICILTFYSWSPFYHAPAALRLPHQGESHPWFGNSSDVYGVQLLLIGDSGE